MLVFLLLPMRSHLNRLIKIDRIEIDGIEIDGIEIEGIEIEGIERNRINIDGFNMLTFQYYLKNDSINLIRYVCCQKYVQYP